MPSYTADASLGVEVGGSFPYTFPFNFGPNASVAYEAAARVGQTITATAPGAIGIVSVIDASQSITAHFTEIMRLSGLMHTPQVITASETVSLLERFVTAGNISLSASANATAGAFVNRGVNASLSVTTATPADSTVPHSADVELNVTGSPPAAVKAAWKASVSRPVTTTLSSAVAHHLNAQASLAALVSTPARPRQDWTCDANLVVGAEQGFPYTFPFSFGASNNSLVRGHVGNASLAAATARTSTGTRGAVGNVSQTISISTSVAILLGHESFANVALSIAVATSAVMIRGHLVDAPQTISTNPNGRMRWDGHFQSQLPVSSLPQSLVLLSTKINTHLTTTAGPSSAVNMSALMRSVLQSQAAIVEGFVHGYKFRTDLPVTVNSTTTLKQTLKIDATLPVRATAEVNTPIVSGFWPFYLT